MDDTCGRFDAWIARTPQLTAEQAAELEAHLASCPSCRELVRAMKPVADDVAFAVTGASDTMMSGDGGTTARARGDYQLGETTADRYRITGEVGRGGIGRVLRALDQVLDRPVALKELFTATDGTRQRFVREALITARLQHPSIVPVYDAGHLGDRSPFYAMKLVAGRPLDRSIADATTLAQRLALLPSVLAVADAMAYAHSERIIHRDLKPQNVLVGNYGETIVIDWGLAKDLALEDSDALDAGPYRAASLDQTVAGMLLGTPAYMAPEQAAGEPLDERADVYALGAILYHVVSGAIAHEGTTLEEMVHHVMGGDVRPLTEREPDVPRDLAAIVTKAMSLEPSARYANAQGFADDLRRFLNGQLVGSHHYRASELLRRWVRRHRAAVMVAIAALVVVSVVGIASIAGIVRAKGHADDAAAVATQERNVATDTLTDMLEEQGRQELLAGRPARGAVYLSEAYARSRVPSVGLRSLVADAMQSIEAQRIILDAGGGGLSTAAFSPDGTRIVGGTQIWDSATGKILTVLRGQYLEIESAAFSSDGSRVVTTSFDDKAQLWAANTGELLATFDHDHLRSASLRLDGKRLVTAGDGGAKLWNVETKQLVGTLARPRDLVVVAAFSPDGTAVVTASEDDAAEVWDATTMKRIASLDDHVRLAVFSPDGTQIVTASSHGTAKLWNAHTGRLVASFDGHAGPVRAAAFSRDGSRIVTASEDRTAKVWDAATGKLVTTLEGHGAAINSAAFSPDGSRIVTAGSDHTAKLWDVRTGRLLASFEGHTDDVSLATFSPDGKTVLTASEDGTARLWDTRPSKLRLSLDAGSGHPTKGRLAADGTTLVTAAEGDTTAKVWDLRSGKLVRSLEGHRGEIVSTELDAAGDRVVTASLDHTAKVWDIKTARQIASLVHPDEVVFAELSPDGARVVTRCADERARLWNASTGELIAKLEVAGPSDDDDRRTPSAAFSADGQRVVTATEEGRHSKIRIWRTDTGNLVTQFEQRRGVASVAFSPDGERVIASGRDHLVKIWDVRTGQLVSWLDGHTGEIASATFSRDGSRIVTASRDHTAKLWDAKAGKLLASLDGHTDEVRGAMFSPDGARIVTASADHSAKIWDGQTGKLLGSLDGHTDTVLVAAFSADGTRVMTASRDGTVKLWDVQLEQRTPAEIRRIVGDRDPWTLANGGLVPALDGASSPAAAPTPLPSGPVTSNDDYLARLVAVLGQTNELLKDTDCDKLATNMRAYYAANKAQLAALVAWTNTHTIDDAAMMNALAPIAKKGQHRLGVYEKCKGNEAFAAAMKANPMATSD